jgi:hypothetical protein
MELAPRAIGSSMKPFALPGELDRVVALREDTSTTIEHERLRAEQRRHGRL